MTERLESRVDDHMRKARRRLMAELEARIEELAATAALNTPTSEEPRMRGEVITPSGGEAAALEWASDPATDSLEGSGLEEEERLEEALESGDGSGLEEEERFGEMFQSMRGSLGLEEERWADVEPELEQVLESL